MELCAGGPLDTYLHDPDNVLDAMEKARLAAETATGMAYLHMREVDIIHGDMKAGNVLLASDNSVRICDFGMAEAKNRSKTMTSAAAASPTGARQSRSPSRGALQSCSRGTKSLRNLTCTRSG